MPEVVARLASSRLSPSRLWRSPTGQPTWTRPALLAVSALAGVAYAWGMDGAALETFYGAAARSMSMSWQNFLFGAFDPQGTVTVDRLPGALWPQALSLRIFGFHVWAVVLPQVLEGVFSVLILFRVVCRLAGSVADTSNLAAPYILATGSEILPIGGFEGGIPAPTLARLQEYIASGELRVVFVPEGASDPRLEWIYGHCKRTESATGGVVPLRL